MLSDAALHDADANEVVAFVDGEMLKGDVGALLLIGIDKLDAVVEHFLEFGNLFVISCHDDFVAWVEGDFSTRNVNVDATTHDTHDADSRFVANIELHQRFSAESGCGRQVEFRDMYIVAKERIGEFTTDTTSGFCSLLACRKVLLEGCGQGTRTGSNTT